MPAGPRTTRAVLALTTLLLAAATAQHAGAAPATRAVVTCVPAVAHGPAGELEAGGAGTDASGCRYDTGTSSQSPSIQVSRRGVLFVGKLNGGVLRSTDAGRTWTDVPVPGAPNGDEHGPGIHGYVHVDPVTDRVWYLTSGGAASCGGSLAGALVSWSDDVGATWRGTTIACDTYDWGRLVSGPAPVGSASPRAVYFFGVAPRPVGGQRIVYRSLDDGASWQRTRTLASSTTESGAGVTAPDGTVYFDYPEFVGFDPVTRLTDQTHPFKAENTCRAMVAVSEDHGDTWRQEALPGTVACNHLYGQQRVAVDRAGTVYALWTSDLDGRVRMVVSRDRARTWSEPVDVMPPGTTHNNGHANVVAGEPGHVLIASMATTSPVAAVNPRVGVVQGLGDWSAYVTESFDATAAQPHFVTADLDPGEPSQETGEAPSEAQAYVGMNRAGQGWAVFARKGAAPLGEGAQLSAARLVGARR